jgi:hypothetical protein
VVLLLALGCDPTSGLTDSAEAAAPNVKRYFDGAGTRVADGPWSRVVVDVDPDTLYHVGARRLDDREPTFHIFGADARDGCSVGPNAGTWLMGKPLDAPYRVLPYLESSDENGRGTLRFTSLDCEIQDVAVEDAGRPYSQLYDSGYLVPTGQGYTFVDPWRGTTREIAKVLSERLVWQDAILLWADGKLKSFSYPFEPGPELGEDVSAVEWLDTTPGLEDSGQHRFLVEDAQGLHRVTFERESLTLQQAPVLPGGCHLYASTALGDAEGGWAILELPCGARASLVRLDENLEPLSQTELPEAANPAYTQVLTTRSREGELQVVALLYLTDIEQEHGTVWALPADTEEAVKLAERSQLKQVALNAEGSEWAGQMSANYQLLGGVETYDLIHFRWNGETETYAQRVVHNDTTGETLVNFDGVAADLPVFAGFEPIIIAEDVPISSGEASSLIGARRFARVDRFDGETGRLILNDRDFEATGWQELGAGVSPNSLRFSWFMPALLFLENWDSERHVGSLVAYNYELDARATIADGVSSFDLTNYPWDGVIYAVPYGSKKGLWFSKAK